MLAANREKKFNIVGEMLSTETTYVEGLKTMVKVRDVHYVHVVSILLFLWTCVCLSVAVCIEIHGTYGQSNKRAEAALKRRRHYQHIHEC